MLIDRLKLSLNNARYQRLGILDALHGADLADDRSHELTESLCFGDCHGIPLSEDEVNILDAADTPNLGQRIRLKTGHQLDKNIGF